MNDRTKIAAIATVTIRGTVGHPLCRRVGAPAVSALFLGSMFAVGVGLAACSASSAPEGSARTWAGTYACSGSVSATLTKPASTTTLSVASFDATITQSGDTLTVVTGGGDAGPPCMTLWTANDTTATIQPSQTCTGTVSGLSYTEVFTSGSSTLSGTTLTVTFGVTASGNVVGTATETATCTGM